MPGTYNAISETSLTLASVRDCLARFSSPFRPGPWHCREVAFGIVCLSTDIPTMYCYNTVIASVPIATSGLSLTPPYAQRISILNGEM